VGGVSKSKLWRDIHPAGNLILHFGEMLQQYQVSKAEAFQNLWQNFGELFLNISPFLLWRLIWKYLAKFSMMANFWRVIWKYLANIFYDGQLLETYLEISRQNFL
jgi:hypothetical protein